MTLENLLIFGQFTLALTSWSSKLLLHEKGRICTQTCTQASGAYLATHTRPLSHKNLDLPGLHHGPYTNASWSVCLSLYALFLTDGPICEQVLPQAGRYDKVHGSLQILQQGWASWDSNTIFQELREGHPVLWGQVGGRRPPED